MALRARIAARRAEAVERRAIAEAAGGVTWDDVENDAGAVLIHIAANDPATVIRDQDRIIAGCDADLRLLEPMTERERSDAISACLAARYADTDGGAV